MIRFCQCSKSQLHQGQHSNFFGTLSLSSEQIHQTAAGFKLNWWIEKKNGSRNWWLTKLESLSLQNQSYQNHSRTENYTSPERLTITTNMVNPNNQTNQEELKKNSLTSQSKSTLWVPSNMKWTMVNLVQTSRLQNKTEDLQKIILQWRWTQEILTTSPCLGKIWRPLDWSKIGRAIKLNNQYLQYM